MASVFIPTPLRKLTNDLESVSAAGNNVGELLDNLDKAFPGLKERVCDETGNVRRFVNIYVNGEDIRFLDEKATAVKESDEVSIVPAIAGGEFQIPMKDKQRLWLMFPAKLITRPIIWELGKTFDIVTNIRQCSVTDEVGLASLSLEGEREEIKKAIAWLEELGVKVEPVEINTIES